ncbi:MAG: DUF5654 family protein [Candidatus Limnocylindria bacterium]
MIDRGAFLATMVTLASVAFGVIAALAWHAFVTEALALVLPANSGLIGSFVYAVVVTVVAIVVIVWLGKLAARNGGKSAL